MTLRSSIAFIVILCALRTTCYACQCIPPESPVAEFDKSDAVFVGIVTAVSEPDDRFQNIVVSFDVVDSWKGVERPTVKVGTGANGAMCGLGGMFKQGKRYVLYVTKSDRGGVEYTARLCTRTKPIEDAKEDLAAFARFPKLFESPDNRGVIPTF